MATRSWPASARNRLGRGLDYRQHVVEVMRDSARDPAHRFHALSADELLLQGRALGFRLPARRHVALDEHHPDRPALFTKNDRPGLDEYGRAVAVRHRELFDRDAATREQNGRPLAQPVGIGRAEPREFVEPPPHDFARRIAEHLFGRAVLERDDPHRVGADDRVGRFVEKERAASFGRPKIADQTPHLDGPPGDEHRREAHLRHEVDQPAFAAGPGDRRMGRHEVHQERAEEGHGGGREPDRRAGPERQSSDENQDDEPADRDRVRAVDRHVHRHGDPARDAEDPRGEADALAPDEEPQNNQQCERGRQSKDIGTGHRLRAERDDRAEERDGDEEEIDNSREQPRRESVGRIARLGVTEQCPRAGMQPREDRFSSGWGPRIHSAIRATLTSTIGKGTLARSRMAINQPRRAPPQRRGRRSGGCWADCPCRRTPSRTESEGAVCHRLSCRRGLDPTL